MNITKLCYELYKIDWKRSHGITHEIEMDNLRGYYNYVIEFGNDYTYYDFSDTKDYTYNDYLLEFGYNGELYSCYEEFCECEYLDFSYMVWLLDNEQLIEVYIDDKRSR